MRPLAIIFLTLNVSSMLLHAASDERDTGDRFNFSSLVSREGQGIVASLSDLPDGIIPVSVTDEGNENDPDTDLGMVIQEYSIGQTEVTAKQYCNYLNVVATGDNYLLFYNEKMGSDPNVASIKRAVVDGKNQYSVIQDQQGDRGNFPIVYVNLYQAARFCNWLQNQSTPGLTGDALTERGAYTLNGKSSGPIARNLGAIWFIPTESEWYKPAYYKGRGLQAGYWNFANRSDYSPSNSLKGGVNSANYYSSSYTKQGAPYLTPADHFKQSVGTYNTYDMSGNVAEWVATEENHGTTPLKYVARGGSWKSLYYGATLESKFDLADWGMELSKCSRPAYDPAQGYDNIGFRVATSLIVNSAPPNKGAPGATELSPTEVLEAPLLVLAGLGTIFAGKKIYDCRRDSEAVRESEAAQGEEQRQRTAGGPMAETQRGGERNSSAIAHIGEGAQSLVAPFREIAPPGFKEKAEQWNGSTTVETKKAAAKTPLPSPEKLWITQQEKEEIEQSIEEIDPLFDAAVQKYQAYKLFLQEKGDVHPEGLQQLQEMCDAYDAYAAAVATTAEKMKEQFPSEQELWIPWHTAALNVSSEAMMLRHAAIKPYYRIDVFPLQNEATLKQEVLQLRNDSNQKTVKYIKDIKDYQEGLKAVLEEQEDHSQAAVAVTAFQKIAAEVTSLEEIERKINENESEIQQTVVVGATDVNGAYLAYEKEKEKENDNLFALFFLRDKKQRNIVNLVSSVQLKEQFEQFLKEVQVQQVVSSPGGLSPANMMSLTSPGSGGSIGHIYVNKRTRDSIGGRVNPQNTMGTAQPGIKSRQVAASIKGHTVPLRLELQFEEAKKVPAIHKPGAQDSKDDFLKQSLDEDNDDS